MKQKYIFVILILMILIAALTAGCTSVLPSTTSISSSPGLSADNPAGVNQPVTHNHFNVTVEQVMHSGPEIYSSWQQNGEAYLIPPLNSGEEYVGVKVKTVADSQATPNLDIGMLLTSAEGQKSPIRPPNGYPGAVDAVPGGWTEGWIFFTAKKGDTDLKLVFEGMYFKL